ncbi:unnamed protein product [Phaedon cochleariae]|uniref:Amyloid-beta-like protein n=1 Tax=Phaedon cochleariae TaxID=80249 RepID=A0A9N9SHP7_PHACE|nr:unnamed protein product [Phaedon cochleariae]
MSVLPALLSLLITYSGTPIDATSVLENGALGSTSVSHFEPQVAMVCDPSAHGQEVFHPKYMTDQGEWASDLYSKAACFKDKMDILNYCKKVYPKRDITNIVESSHYLKIGSWCHGGTSPSGQSRGKCKIARWVKPFRCLEGPFQSDALLVPENCMFDHIHNQSICWNFGRWNTTAGKACQEKGLQLRSFAMLLPCGISLFSGVEFVCCPKHFKETSKPKKPVDLSISKTEDDPFDNIDDDDDEGDDKDDLADLNDDTELSDDENASEEEEEEDDDDMYDEDIDWDTQSSTSSYKVTVSANAKNGRTTTTAQPTTTTTPDPYFTHFDPRNEHDSYKEAQERLEEIHREKVTRVMKDWSDLEERYQDMRRTDPKSADEFKQSMTQRFQQTVQALEEEGDAEKHQLAAMHQQRVLAHINQRKKEAMTCYTQALNSALPNTHRVQKCLQKLLRSLHKDRAHAISHYRHLLASSIEAAAREQPRILERLNDIDRTVNQSMQMLKGYPDLSAKIGQLMTDYIQALRSKDETPGMLLAMTNDAEQEILDKYKSEIANKQAQKERQRIQEKERKEVRKKAKTELKREKKRMDDVQEKRKYESADEEVVEETYEETKTSITSSTTQGSTKYEPLMNTATSTAGYRKEVDDIAVQEAVEQVARASSHKQDVIRVAHVMSHDISHGEPSYSVRSELYGRKDGKSIYFTLAFAGMALMAAIIVGVAVAKRKTSASPQHQGFVEVDQTATPEERHVANMQINGYENPTYKYFEVKE